MKLKNNCITSNRENTKLLRSSTSALSKINELGEPDSTITLQKYYYDRSSNEIAKLLSMKASAMRMRAARTLEKLKKSLSAAGITL